MSRSGFRLAASFLLAGAVGAGAAIGQPAGLDAAPPSADSAASPPESAVPLEALHDHIDAIRREAGAPSAQVAILTPEETVLWSFGVADPAAGTLRR